jgi:hypothetical protein
LEAEKAKLVAGMWERKSKDLALAKVGELVRMNKIEDLTWKFGGLELEMILRDFNIFMLVTVATSEPTEQSGKSYLQLQIKFRNMHGQVDNVTMGTI